MKKLMLIAVVLLAGCCSHDATLQRALNSATKYEAIAQKAEHEETQKVAASAADRLRAFVHAIEPEFSGTAAVESSQ